MEISKLFVQARSATVQIADGGLYHTKAVYQLFLNGQAAGTADTAVTSLYDLQPETEYVLSVRWGGGGSRAMRVPHSEGKLHAQCPAVRRGRRWRA